MQEAHLSHLSKGWRIEPCGSLYAIEESDVHLHLALVILMQENEEGSGSGEQRAKMNCGSDFF